MRMQSRLIEKAPCETEVSVTSEVTVTGILAQFGRGMIQDVSNQMFRQFSESVRAELEKAESTEGEPASSLAPPSSTAAVATSTAVAPVSSGVAPSSAAAPAPAPAPAPSAAPAPAAPSSPPPIDVVALGGRVMGRAAVRALHRPMFWIAVAVVLAVVWFSYR